MEHREHRSGHSRTGVTETDTFVDLYKLHAELADRVSQRREGANRLHVSIAVGLVVFLGTLIRFSEDQTLDAIVTLGVGICGLIVSASWYIVLRSYRQLNSEKFRVLHDLETRLPYQFFTMEWDPESVGTKSNRYWKLSVLETIMPVMFGALFLGVTIWSVAS